VTLRDRREPRGVNWLVREAVGIRQPRPRRDYGARVLERLEEELRREMELRETVKNSPQEGREAGPAAKARKR
jgi:hypothetical protein